MRFLRIVVFVSCLGTSLLAQSPAVTPNAGDLIRDSARFNVSPSQTVMAIWYPFEMIAALAKLQIPGATDELLESSGSFMRGCAVFMVQASHRDGEGRETFLSENEIGAIASVTDRSGRVLRCVTDPPPYLATTLAMVKAGYGGQPGSDHAELIVFDNKDAEGAFILQPMRPGGFALQLRSESGLKTVSLDWETPLPSLAGVTRCARCGAALSPGWHFCPICGLAAPKEPEIKETTPRTVPLAPIRLSFDVVPPNTSTIPYGISDPGVTLPSLVREVKPQYTTAALDKRIGGTVVLDCVVGTDGKVTECRVTRSLDAQSGLDEEAMKAARQWVFRPGKRNGIPVPVLVTIELTFHPRAK